MIGNIFFSFSYIDETGQTFQDWVAMVGGLFEGMGVEKTDINTHKTIIAFFSGGLLPIISLTFAHMLVMFTENNQDTHQVPTKYRPSTDQVEELTTEEARRLMEEKIKQEEEIKYKPTPEDLEKIEKIVKVKYIEPEDVPSNPYVPTEENLEELQKILDQYQNYVVDNTTVETIEEEITPEILTEEPLVNGVKNDEPKYRSLIYVKPQ